MSDFSVNSWTPLSAVIRIPHLNLPIPLAAMIGSHSALNWAMVRDFGPRTVANTRFRRREV